MMNITAASEMFSSLRILVIGDAMLDEYLLGSVTRMSPEALVPLVSINRKDYRLGGAANVALNIQSMDASALLCCCVGDDHAGAEISRLINESKITSPEILVIRNRISTVKSRVISHGKHLLRFDSELTDDLSFIDEFLYLEKIRTLIEREKPDAVIFEDYNKGALTEKVISGVISICRSKNILTAVDPKKKNFFAYQNADVFKPNLREVREALNRNVTTEVPELSAVHEELKLKLHHRITIITLGDQGIFFSDGKQSAVIPAHKRNIADVSGAGDTVIAVATIALASGMELKDAMSFANLAGGLVCEHAGVVPVTRGMLNKHVASI